DETPDLGFRRHQVPEDFALPAVQQIGVDLERLRRELLRKYFREIGARPLDVAGRSRCRVHRPTGPAGRHRAGLHDPVLPPVETPFDVLRPAVELLDADDQPREIRWMVLRETLRVR